MFVLFAAVEGFDRQVKEAAQGGRFDTRDALMAISISVAIGVLLFVWAYFRYRKKEDGTRDDRKQRHMVSKQETVEPGSEGDEPERRRRRKRRRRRDHRPRNPSLQQTGGLPPTRPDDELPKD
ncbi:MAG TPA: hypothetical protein VNT99_18640 [Methylomirabilota bacterium]|nr:hypothetical protein [Methylomirabilota bacterium]